MPLFRPAVAIAGGLILFCLTGCQTEGGFGATVADVRDSIGGMIGLEPTRNQARSDVKEQIDGVAAHQRLLRDEVQSTYDELVMLTEAPAGALDAPYTDYTAAVARVRAEAGVTTRLRAEAHHEADAYTADVTRTLSKKVSNPGVQKVAERNLNLLKSSMVDVLGSAGRYDVDLSPLLGRFDRQAAALKQGVTAETVGRVQADLADLKREVQTVLAKLDQQVLELDKLGKQVDTVDASVNTLGL